MGNSLYTTCLQKKVRPPTKIKGTLNRQLFLEIDKLDISKGVRPKTTDVWEPHQVIQGGWNHKGRLTVDQGLWSSLSQTILRSTTTQESSSPCFTDQREVKLHSSVTISNKPRQLSNPRHFDCKIDIVKQR